MSEASEEIRSAPEPYRPMSIADLGRALATVRPDEPVPWRLIREFLLEFSHEEPASREALLRDPPPPTGSEHWDAFLAAVAEHLAFHHEVDCPAWTQDQRRSLTTAWFVSELPAARAAAMESSPASFRRRLIFLDRADLDVA
jgi:hypothetical protein